MLFVAFMVVADLYAAVKINYNSPRKGKLQYVNSR